ncbi:hypothetical protein J7643_01790 [bacterium]|nr:hypothetical protein [bacterium]
MIRRGIHLPTRRRVLGTAFVIFGLMTVAIVGWAMTVDLTAELPAIAASLIVSIGLLALIAGVIDLMHRLDAAGWRFEEPRLSRWVAYYGAWGVVGLVIGLGRVAMIQAKTGILLAPGRVAYVVAVCFYVSVAMVCVLENQAMFVTAIARKQDASRRAVRFLFQTREAFVQARNRRQHEALSFLERQLEPELAALQGQVARMVEDGRSSHEIVRLRERIDRLRDDEIREISHLLHPSIIDMGLAPALRALVRNRSDALPIRLHLADLPPQGLSPEVGLHLYRIVEHALDEVRVQAVREIHVSLACDEGNRLRLEIALQGEELDLALARKGGARALLDARVAMLNGAWRLERGEDARLVLRLEAPLAGA